MSAPVACARSISSACSRAASSGALLQPEPAAGVAGLEHGLDDLEAGDGAQQGVDIAADIGAADMGMHDRALPDRHHEFLPQGIDASAEVACQVIEIVTPFAIATEGFAEMELAGRTPVQHFFGPEPLEAVDRV